MQKLVFLPRASILQPTCTNVATYKSVALGQIRQVLEGIILYAHLSHMMAHLSHK